MPEIGLGAFNQRAGYTEGYCYSTATLVSSRACSDGTRPLVIIDIYGAVSGRFSSRSGTMYVGGSAWGYTVASAGSAQDTGWVDSSNWLSYGGTGINYGYDMVGSTYFARSSSGITYDAFGNFTGTVGMYYRYWECASAPTISSVTPSADGTQATVTFSAPADNGGTAVTGYRVQRSTSAAFTSPTTVDSASSPLVMTGLTPGTTYYYRVTARNAVTDTASKLGGTWSSSSSATQPTAPSAPTIVSVVSNTDGTQATVTIGAPASNGGSPVLGYNIQRATNAGFSTGLATVASAGTTIMTGLTPGATYYYRATARNAVTDGQGALGGPWSGTTSLAQNDPTGLGRRYNGSTFVSSDGKRYNGSIWEALDGKQWNGSSWQDIGL